MGRLILENGLLIDWSELKRRKQIHRPEFDNILSGIHKV